MIPVIREWTLVPLGLSALCALWIWIANRRPRVAGLTWPRGVELAGSLAKPDLIYPGDVVLGCEARFRSIQCRSLSIAKGAEVQADTIVASRVRVDGELTGVKSLAAGTRLDVRGVLEVEDLRAKKVILGRRSKTTALVVTGNPVIERHPKANVRGFFDSRTEIPDSTRASTTKTRSRTLLDDTTERVHIVR